MAMNYIHAREDICCDMWGFEEDKYIYTLLTNETGMHCIMDGLKVIKDAPFDYRATVYVDVNTGEITRDYENSVLPKKC